MRRRNFSFVIILILAFLLPVQSWAATALRQNYSAGTNSVGSVVVVANDLIIVGHTYNAGPDAAAVCTDNAAGGTNTYTRITGTQNGSGGTIAMQYVSYAIAKASETVTITCFAEGFDSVHVHIVSGADTTLGTVLDTSNTANVVFVANPTNWVGPNVTVTAGDYIFSVWGEMNNDTTTLNNNGGTFTIDAVDKQLVLGGASTAAGRMVDVSAGTYHMEIDTDRAAIPDYTTIIAAFKAAGAATGTVAVTGTATASITEADVVTGGKTVILTLTGDTWVTTGATFDAQRQNIINGMDSAQAEATGWDAEVKAKIAVTDVVQTSSTVVTITLDAEAAYNITATETITVTVPSTATTLNAGAIVATPTFAITAMGGGVPTGSFQLLGVGR